jgi:hypothetical protein
MPEITVRYYGNIGRTGFKCQIFLISIGSPGIVRAAANLGMVEDPARPPRNHSNLSVEFPIHLAVVDQGGRKAKKKASLRRHPGSTYI